jgi:hypothetical protein
MLAGHRDHIQKDVIQRREAEPEGRSTPALISATAGL